MVGRGAPLGEALAPLVGGLGWPGRYGVSPLEWVAAHVSSRAGKVFSLSIAASPLRRRLHVDNVSSIVYTFPKQYKTLTEQFLLKAGNYDVLIYQDEAGHCPYVDWLNSLDWKMRERILARAARMKQGQFGDFKALGDDLYELRLFFGPGYRVYFGEDQGMAVLILAGGDKSTQRKDIKDAKKYWQLYLENQDG